MRITVTPDLLQRLDRPGPRYTSYPPVPAWSENFDDREWLRALAELAGQPERDVCLYVHLPFCGKRCLYCGCNAEVPSCRLDVDRYLDHLARELDLMVAVTGRRRVVQMHWGGGTPNFLTPAQLRRTWGLLGDRFELVGEMSLECDPRAGNADQPHLLRELGFNRLSLGVQDFSPRVQAAIGRRQPERIVRRFVAAAREAGFLSVNLDLVYGLPRQTPAVFADSLQKALALACDRLAVFGYAHVPWAKPHQKAIAPETLPSGPERFALYQQAVETLTAAGYVWIGLDHFARPDDELAAALQQRRLHRNFMGYTTQPGLDMLAIGASAIGEVCARFAQNAPAVASYEQALAAGRLPVVRGLRLDANDRLRRRVILHLMCNLELPWQLTVAEFGRPLHELLPDCLQPLDELAAAGLIALHDAGLQVTDLGRFFLRNVAMVFDAYLDAGGREPRYSRTV